MSKSLAINRCPEDVEFLISRWSIESHTFVAAWGELCPTLEDFIVLKNMPVFREARIIKWPGDSEEINFGGERKKKLETLNKALTDSKSRPRALILRG